MRLAANQPYFLPYIGYWQLIHAADVFLIGDDYSYRTRSWISRNRILLNGAPKYFGIEIREASCNRLCSELQMMEINKKRKWDQLYDAYHRAPYFNEGMGLAEEILNCEKTVLSEFLEYSIRVICEYLGIDTPIMRTSDLEGNSLLRREHRIYDMCRRLGADTYVNAIGGTQLYDFKEFRERGIRLEFIKSDAISYRQYKEPFVGNLSILDVIMFNPVGEIRKMLDMYTLLTQETAL